MSQVNVFFLGTGSAPPQLERSQSAIVIKYNGHHILVDAGEGTQRQMIRYKVGLRKKLLVLLTHLHADHTLGLIGLLSTRCFYGLENPVTIVGPPGTSNFVYLNLLAYGLFPDYDIKVIEVTNDIIVNNKDFYIEAFRTLHCANSVGYKFVIHPPLGKFNVEKIKTLGIPPGETWKNLKEGIPIKIGDRVVYPSEILEKSTRKPLKIVITGDTRLYQNVINHAAYADLLIHDATYPPLEGERAVKYYHSTCSQAALAARAAKVKKLVMTHISNLHTDLEYSLREARKIFPEAIFAYDGMKLTIRPE